MARDAPLEVADSVEVFVELAPVGFAEGAVEAELPAGGLGGGWLSVGLSAEDKFAVEGRMEREGEFTARRRTREPGGRERVGARSGRGRRPACGGWRWVAVGSGP